MGATDAALGNVRPDNTSAIVALQQASNLPLENQKRGIRRFFENLGLIWLDFMLCYYDSSRLLFFRENDQPRAELLGLTGICNTLFQCNVEVGESAYWSEIACVSTLDNLLAKGAIEAVQEQGLLGAFTGGASASAGGVTGAIFFGCIFALLARPKTK